MARSIPPLPDTRFLVSDPASHWFGLCIKYSLFNSSVFKTHCRPVSPTGPCWRGSVARVVTTEPGH
eukprot:1050483-Pyramimonas_sp.AAC.1